MIYTEPRPILYVDDTEEQRYAMRRILETAGFRVIEAGNGAEAIQAMTHRPSLVILDVRLPDMNGYEVCRVIKQDDPTIPVLQVSASFSDPNLRASGLSGGADAYIAQPVHPAELVALVRALLRTSTAEATIHFLAHIGPALSSSLTFPETASNVCAAMVPHFADRCVLYLPNVPGLGEFWNTTQHEPELAVAVEGSVDALKATKLSPSTIVAPLSLANHGLGAIAFVLEPSRQYTEQDVPLATELGTRAGLALQNCMLFTAERSTREALIHTEKLAAAGRLSAAIAHEINNPLEAVTNLIYLIQSSPETSNEVRNYAATALSELNRLAHIARQSLGFYREMKDPTICDLGQTVHETLELYQSRLASKDIQVQFDLHSGITVNAIQGELRQVVSNLLVNALDAIEAAGTIGISVTRDSDNAVLTVEDTGSGISSSIRPHVFDAFFTTKQGTGTGLGLWVSQNIVEKHGGRILVLDEGLSAPFRTAFRVTLPLAH